MKYITKAGVKFIKESRSGRQYPKRGRAYTRSVNQRYGQLSQTKRDTDKSITGRNTPLARRLRAIPQAEPSRAK